MSILRHFWSGVAFFSKARLHAPSVIESLSYYTPPLGEGGVCIERAQSAGQSMMITLPVRGRPAS